MENANMTIIPIKNLEISTCSKKNVSDCVKTFYDNRRAITIEVQTIGNVTTVYIGRHKLLNIHEEVTFELVQAAFGMETMIIYKDIPESHRDKGKL